MTFSAFKKSISKIGNIALPGKDSHLEMTPKERLEILKKNIPKQKTAQKAGVLALFYPNSHGEAMLVLILRKTYKGVHSAQIGFPGGRVEPEDENLMQTALRETEEEIGVPREKITVLRQLTEVFVPPSNFLVYPFVGFMEETPSFSLQASEVEAVLEVSIEDFMDNKVLTEEEVDTSYLKKVKVPGFRLQDHLVWGATGMMLNELRAILKKML